MSVSKFKFYLLIAMAVCGTAVSTSRGSVFSSFITTDGIVDNFTDESRSALQDNGDGVLGAGDTLYGMIRFSNANPSGELANQAINNQLSIVFSATIDSGSGTTASPFKLVPTAPGSAYSLPSLLNDNVQGGYADGNAIWSSAIGVLLENNSTANTDNPIAFTGATAPARIANYNAASGWSFDLIAGFDTSGAGGTNQFGSVDTFLATADFSLGGGKITGKEAGGFSVLAGIPSSMLEPVSLTHPGGGTSFHDATLDFPDTEYKNFGSPSLAGTPWQFSDKSSFSINVIPEPVSALIWVGMAFVFSGAARRAARQV